jgi:hypothetical protein
MKMNFALQILKYEEEDEHIFYRVPENGNKQEIKDNTKVCLYFNWMTG